MASKFKYGSVVSYQNELYFIAPNGSSCFLYEYSDQVGFTQLAKHTPSLNSITKPDPAQAKEYALTHKTRPGLTTFRPYRLDELDREDVLELTDSLGSSG